MNTKEITAIAIKFLAIWLLVQILLQVPSLLLVFNNIEGYVEKEFPINLYVSVVGSLLFIGSIASYLLFRVSNSVLNSIPNTSNSEPGNISQEFLMQLGGTYFIISSLMVILGVITSIRVQVPTEFTNNLRFLGAFFELAVGFSMLIKSNVWVLWFAKLRGRE